MKTAFAILLLSVATCFGQFGVEQPFFLKVAAAPTGPAGPDTIPGLAYWWVASDLPVGAMTNWVDRIQGVIMTNASASMPTNSASGVYFSGSTFLTNASIQTAGNSSIMLVIKATSNTGLTHLIGPTASNPDWIFDWGHVVHPYDWQWNAVSGQNLGYRILINAVDTLLMSHANGGSWYCYTNFVSASIISAGNLGYLKLEGIANSSGRYVGYVLEEAIWTNSLSDANINTLSNYVKTLYP